MEELTATVENITEVANNNATAAEKSYETVREAAEHAGQSREDLERLTEAMQRIDATSKEIQKMIFEKYMETYTDAKPGMPFFLKMKGNTVIQILEKPMA